MKILVCIKQVPDTTEVKIDPVTKNLVRDGVPSIMNPYDQTALCQALAIKKKYGGRVVAVSMGPEQAIKELNKSLRLGADEAFLLTGRELGGADTLATGYALAQIIAKIGYDLILCGNEAIDGCTGQVGPCIGENLQIPAFTYVKKLEIKHDEVIIQRDTGKSIDTYSAKMPLVACMMKQGTETIESVGDVTRKEVKILHADFMDREKIGVQGSPTKVAAISVKEKLQNYLQVDYRWSCEERLAYIINGGLEKKKVSLVRGNKEVLVDALIKAIVQAEEEKGNASE